MDIQSLLAKHCGESLLQLACRLVCKGDGEDIPRTDRVNGNDVPEGVEVVCPALCVLLQEGGIIVISLTGGIEVGIAEVDHIRDTVYYNRGLAASCACKHKNGTVNSENGLLLHIVHTAEITFQRCLFC